MTVPLGQEASFHMRQEVLHSHIWKSINKKQAKLSCHLSILKLSNLFMTITEKLRKAPSIFLKKLPTSVPAKVKGIIGLTCATSLPPLPVSAMRNCSKTEERSYFNFISCCVCTVAYHNRSSFMAGSVTRLSPGVLRCRKLWWRPSKKNRLHVADYEMQIS